MDLDGFQLGSPVHIACLLVCSLAFALVVMAGSLIRDRPRLERVLRRIIVIGCLLSWLLTFVYSLHPNVFRWDFSLPLQFCNLANLIGAVAIERRVRIAQSLVYFWSLVLCSWAFFTPSLTYGPAHSWFWIFWLYHLFIPISFGWILGVDLYQPTGKDLRDSLLITIAYMGALALLDAVTGWNYGFVGPGKPGQPSLIDFLGPYPHRLLSLLLLGSALFGLALLPWIRKGKVPRNSS